MQTVIELRAVGKNLEDSCPETGFVSGIEGTLGDIDTPVAQVKMALKTV